MAAVDNVRTAARGWNKAVFGNILENKKSTMEGLEKLQAQRILSEADKAKQYELMNYYQQLLRCEELLWY